MRFNSRHKNILGALSLLVGLAWGKKMIDAQKKIDSRVK